MEWNYFNCNPVFISRTVHMMAHSAQLFSSVCDQLTEQNDIVCAFFMFVVKVHADCECRLFAANFQISLLLCFIISPAVLVFFLELLRLHFGYCFRIHFAAVLVFIILLFSFCRYFLGFLLLFWCFLLLLP